MAAAVDREGADKIIEWAYPFRYRIRSGVHYTNQAVFQIGQVYVIAGKSI